MFYQYATFMKLNLGVIICKSYVGVMYRPGVFGGEVSPEKGIYGNLSHACENATKIVDLVVQNVAKKVFCPNVRLGELQILILEGLS